MKVSLYSPDDRSLWESFIDVSKNGVFLFKRDYMEYHADRFADFSLLLRGEDEDLLAIMPASINDDIVSSHGGLTFGGLVVGKQMKAAMALRAFEVIRAFLEERGVRKLVYKAMPHIYHRYPAEEDLYGLFRAGARHVRRDISSTIALADRLPFSKGRKYSIKQARKSGLTVRESRDFETFMAIEEKLLDDKYDTKPTHSAAEIALLAERFPEQIRLFGAFSSDRMVAGVVIYEHVQVAHAQYIASSDDGKRSGALDLVISFLIEERYTNMKFFDFGISTENLGQYLNEGLIDNKQSFGGRAIVHDFYELDIASHAMSS